MLTSPAPVKVRFVPPVMLAEPLPTEKLTSRSLDAVAASSTTLVVTWFAIKLKLIAWPAFPTKSVPVASP